MVNPLNRLRRSATAEPTPSDPAGTAQPFVLSRTRFGAWLGKPMTSFHLIVAVAGLLVIVGLAAVVLPLVLISFWYGLTNQVAKHRKITRFTFPIWLYVTTTGVIVYLMISPYYPS